MIMLAVRRLPLILLAIALLAVVGCKEEPITEYDAPREEQQRLLAAMMPRGETTWSFKLAGPAHAVTMHKEEFDQFVETVRFTDKAEPDLPPPPNGWKKQEDSPSRFAAFELGGSDAPLEMTVIRTSGPEAANVMTNVNRWRGQLGLREVLPAELPQCTRSMTISGTLTTFVDVSGPGDTGPMKPRDTGPVGAPTYTPPAGWTKKTNPPDKMASIRRVATFEAGQGERIAEVTIVVFTGQGDIYSNIERWRGMVGLPPATATEELDKHLRPQFKVLGGLDASYVDISGPGVDGKSPKRMLAVLARRGLQYWTVKIEGSPDVIEKQKPAFDEFIGTVRFPEGKSR